MSTELAYSAWHRSLGFSYFAMDLDYIEIRENNPVAIIESSLTTPANPTFDAVINRFLRETRGFQFEMAYWVSLWLNVPVYLICLHPLIFNEDKSKFEIREGIKILNLQSGEDITLNYAEYVNFIQSLPDDTEFFTEPKLELPELLEKLIKKYPSFQDYPYFNANIRNSWLRNYELRMNEIAQRIKRTPPTTYSTKNFPVKGETTGKRLQDYEILRKAIDLPYVNLNWVEWRKDKNDQRIGRPAALVKTVLLQKSGADFSELGEQEFKQFSSTDEFKWWNEIAARMAIPWYFTVYRAAQNGIGDTFFVWSSLRNGSKTMTRQQYEVFIKKL